METVQLAISDATYASSLREMLARNPDWRILRVAVPDPRIEGVMVVDRYSLERMPEVIQDPQRIVLVTSNDPKHLARAWEKGIASVVFENDPVKTATLAIMAVRLNLSKESARRDPAAMVDKPMPPKSRPERECV
jgi:hypothetical protein